MRRNASTSQSLRVAARSQAGAETDIVDDVSFTVAPGEVLALIGESRLGQDHHRAGADGLCAPRLPHRAAAASASATSTCCACRRRQSRASAGRRVTYIAQSAAASFNPAHRSSTRWSKPPSSTAC